MVKTKSLIVELFGKIISNNYSIVKMDFRFHKKSEQLALMYTDIQREGIFKNSQIAFEIPQNV